jgi:dynein heavy chain
MVSLDSNIIRNQSNPMQLILTAAQIIFTQRVTNAILESKDKSKKNQIAVLLQFYNQISSGKDKDKDRSYLAKLCSFCSNASDLDRLKYVSLITQELHCRDVLAKLNKPNVTLSSYEWLSTLRFVYEAPDKEKKEGKEVRDDIGRFYIRHLNPSVTFDYGFEYQGNVGRLVITPLTDRCILTLTSALALHKGLCLSRLFRFPLAHLFFFSPFFLLFFRW